MNNEQEVKKATLRNLREEMGLISKITSYFGFPVLIFNRLYIGPGQYEINDFNMDDEKTREYVRQNPDAIEKIQLMQNEAFVRISAYWSSLCTRRFDCNLIYENETWKVKNKRLSGMS